jgi:hypothetical protein
MPNGFQETSGESSMGPRHSAIVLSESVSSSNTDTRTENTVTLTSNLRQSNNDTIEPSRTNPSTAAARRIDTIRQRFAELTGRVEDRPNADQPTDGGSGNSSTPLFGPRSQESSQANRAILMAYLLRDRERSSNPADATTSLGRRVEARAAAVRSPPVQSSDARIDDAIDESSLSVTLLSRQRERLLESSRNFRSTALPTSGQNTAAGRTGSSTVARPPSTQTLQSTRERTMAWREALREGRLAIPDAASASIGNPNVRALLTLPPLPPAPPMQRSVDSHPDPPWHPSERSGLETEAEGTTRSRRLRRFYANRDPLADAPAVTGRSEVEEDNDPYSWLMGEGARPPQAPINGLDNARSRVDMLGRMRTMQDEDSGRANSGAEQADPAFRSLRRPSARPWANEDDLELPPMDEVSEIFRRRRRRGWSTCSCFL